MGLAVSRGPAFARALIAFVVGLTTLRLAVSGKHRQFVRAGLGPFLIAAAITLCALAILAVVRTGPRVSDTRDHLHARQVQRDEQDAEAPESVGPGWLLLVPVMALFLIAPAPIGSWGLGQVGSSTGGRTRNWAPLPTTREPLGIRIREVVGRANDAPSTIRQRPLLLEGFVVKPGQSFRLARYSIACCAADAQGAQVEIEGQPTRLPVDSWVRVTGLFESVRGETVVVKATSVESIPSPAEPFE